MKCEEVRDKLDLYRLGELGGFAAKRIERHVHECRGCYQELREARECQSLLEDLGQHLRPSRPLSERVLQSIQDLPAPASGFSRSRPTPSSRRWMTVAVAAAAVIVASVAVALLLLSDESPEAVRKDASVDAPGIRVFRIENGQWTSPSRPGTLRTGDRFEIVDDSAVTFGEEGEWQARLSGPAECRVGGTQESRDLELNRGRVEIEVQGETESESRLSVKTAHGRARGVGGRARFTVTAGRGASEWVEVDSGEVLVSASGESGRLAASESIAFGASGLEAVSAVAVPDESGKEPSSDDTPGSGVTGGVPTRGLIASALERPLQKLLPLDSPLRRYLNATVALLEECERARRDADLIATSQVPHVRLRLLETFSACQALRHQALKEWGIDRGDLRKYDGMKPRTKGENGREGSSRVPIAELWAARERVADDRNWPFEESRAREAWLPILNSFVADVLAHAEGRRVQLRSMIASEDLPRPELAGELLLWHAGYSKSDDFPYSESLWLSILELIADPESERLDSFLAEATGDPWNLAIAYSSGWLSEPRLNEIKRRDQSANHDPSYWEGIRSFLKRQPPSLSSVLEQLGPQGAAEVLSWAICVAILDYAPTSRGGDRFKRKGISAYWASILRQSQSEIPGGNPLVAWLASRGTSRRFDPGPPSLPDDSSPEVQWAFKLGLIQAGYSEVKELEAGGAVDLVDLTWTSVEASIFGRGRSDHSADELRIEAIAIYSADPFGSFTKLEKAIDQHYRTQKRDWSSEEIRTLANAIRRFVLIPDQVRFSLLD